VPTPSPTVGPASEPVRPTSCDDRTILTWSWQRQLAAALRTPSDLLSALGLPADVPEGGLAAAAEFPVLVPHSFLFRMEKGNRDDPLLRQVLAVKDEQLSPPGFRADPVGDQFAERAPGMLHKYHGRVLLITTGTCAVHCRYCFRRHYPYVEAPHRPDEWEPAFREIEADQSVEEVILSGGDPLVLSDERLASLWSRLESIPHVQRVRIHSRLPIVLPARVTDRLLDLLRGSRLQSIVVVHANHARELEGDCGIALRQLTSRGGIMVLNQAVLLAGVNDTVAALETLSQSLIRLGVIPYYLHQLDRVLGAAHFEVAVARGLELMESLRVRLPGYAIPQYVREVPGELSKQPLWNVPSAG
jgi:EF-P beta-lysylation protein EpmB